jgi:hypothetical protein
MANSVYQINKGINAVIEFRGLKAQYIWWLGGGLVCILVLFAILYICGVNTFICLGIALVSGGCLFRWVYAVSNRYGQYGMQKKAARRLMPKLVRNGSRKVFIKKG